MASGGRASRPNVLSWAASNGVTIGSPNAPNVILMVAEQAVITTLLVFAVSSLGLSESAFAFLALVVAVLFATSLMTCEVRVGSESISRRSWFAIARGRPATIYHITPGQPISRMPDGMWLLDGVAFSPRLPWWEVRRLGRAVDEAGLIVDDQKSAWRKAHPVRTVVSWCSRAVAEASLLGTLVAGALHPLDPHVFAWLPLVVLAGSVALILSRPPHTSEPRKP